MHSAASGNVITPGNTERARWHPYLLVRGPNAPPVIPTSGGASQWEEQGPITPMRPASGLKAQLLSQAFNGTVVRHDRPCLRVDNVDA